MVAMRAYGEWDWCRSCRRHADVCVLMAPVRDTLGTMVGWICSDCVERSRVQEILSQPIPVGAD